MGIWMKHKSVLLEESISFLNIKETGVYVDATLGFGGHSLEILKRINKGFLFAFDQDSEAIKYSKERLKDYNNYKIIKSNFVNMKECLANENIHKVDGVLFDIGVSSMQLDEDYRGFSYHNDAKLDMRMDTDSPLSAYEVVNMYPYEDLVRILRDYGEEKYATSIARNIIKARENKNIETTLELVEIIKHSMPAKELRDGHPARKTFQAIRIEVNHELDVLASALEQAIDLLNIGGRVCVITFHSLEDRIVKNIFRKYSEVDSKFAKLPYVPEEYLPKCKIICKGITASREELMENNRARSARLRVIEKVKD
jgi:16S rRNA (cytosine1402-N4)-methyltransferase